MRVLVAAFGDAGHAFPAVALARALRGRGHDVLVETWERWREAVEGEGVAFAAAEQYRTFPPPEEEGVYPSAADAARPLVPLIRDWGADVVVSDILTLAPTLAAEIAGTRRVTLVPHVYPVHEPGLPYFAVGAQPPRTAFGRAAWRAALPVLLGGLHRGRDDLNRTRAEVGLAPLERFHGGMSEELVLVATFPQLEYPRPWPEHVRVTGPMLFELPWADVEVPAGDEPLVLVAPSTAQDPDGLLVRATLEALADEPLRVVATLNRRDAADPLPDAPPNAVVVDWLSYSQLMPLAALVICHGGHGTVARALADGVPVLACPAVGDMAENAARVAWARVGLALPGRWTRPAPIRWAARRILGDPAYAARAAEFARWSATNDGAEHGALAIEELVGSPE